MVLIEHSAVPHKMHSSWRVLLLDDNARPQARVMHHGANALPNGDRVALLNSLGHLIQFGGRRACRLGQAVPRS